MKKKVKQLDELISGLNYSFSIGFSSRVMERIRETEQTGLFGYYPSTCISRLFYYINIPGLAATVLILVFLLLSGYFGPVSLRHHYNSTIAEFLNDYYLSLIN